MVQEHHRRDDQPAGERAARPRSAGLHACFRRPRRSTVGDQDRQIEIIPVNTLRTIFVKMHTDAGVVGIGEGTVEGRIGTVVAAIKELEPYLIGKDPRQPAHHWQAIYRQAFR